jgi:hypothetical protein
METAKMPFNIKKMMSYTYIYVCIYKMHYYSAIKKNKIVAFAEKRLEMNIIMLSEASQVQ